MYYDVGRELKNRAETHVWLSMLKFMMIGAATGAVFATLVLKVDSGAGIIILLGMAIFGFYGFWKGRERALMFYSYAEIVDCAVRVQEYLDNKERGSMPNELVCKRCGFQNDNDAKFCNNCGCIIKE